LPCENEASHVAVANQSRWLSRLLAGPAPEAPILQPNTLAAVARDKFAQKLSSLRRNVVARIFAQ
jgi:predicted DNA-binding transcriptional regulator YafY